MSNAISHMIQSPEAGALPPQPPQNEVDTQTLLEQQATQQHPTQVPSDLNNQAQQLTEHFNLDVEAIGSHWLEKGAAPDDVVTKLGSVGITKDMIEEFISNRYEKFQAGQSALIDEVGGQESLQQMQAWGASNWSQEQVEAYNEAVDSGDRGKIQLALSALKSSYIAANPPPQKKPQLVTATNVVNGGNGGVAPYLSVAQAQRDFQNPLYKQDPAFRAMVQKRLAISNV